MPLENSSYGVAGAFDSILQWLDERLDDAQRGNGKPLLALVLLSPALLILAAFGLFPIGYAVYLSLFESSGMTENFIGAANYGEALASEAFWDSVAVTFYYALGTVVPTLVISFVIAKGLFSITRFRNLLRTLYFLPFVSSVVAAAMVWRSLLNPRQGVANLMLGALGLPEQNWLLEPRGVLNIVTDGFIAADVGPSLALCCVILFEIWRSTGFMVVVFLAGLAAIPRELEDAARIDGAGPVRVAMAVTLPMLSPTIFFLSIVGVIGSFQAFNSLYALTGDGRGLLDSTQNLTVYIFTNFYVFGRTGYGAAVAILLAVAIMALTLIQWRIVGRRVHYQ